MTYYIGCDAHKHYSMFAVLDDEGQLHQQIRVNHAPKAIKGYLSQFPVRNASGPRDHRQLVLDRR